jgi:DNA-binding response OmpR family regulator
VRILIVEDEPRLVELLARSLRGEGYDVATAADGADGFELARAGGFDLVVLDVMLPRMSGLEITMRLRRHAVRTPILMLTARDAVEDRVAGLEAGADDDLVKPFAFVELSARIRALLRRRGDAGGPSPSATSSSIVPAARRSAAGAAPS